MKNFLNIQFFFREYLYSCKQKTVFVEYIWFCFIGVFMLSGIIGHDPWKQDETYSFGIIYHFYTAHSWIVPQNAGTAFMEKPPLYYWTAVILCKAFYGVISLPDAARLASYFYMLVALCFIWKSSGVIYRNNEQAKDIQWIAVLLFLGTIGVVRHSHDMFTDVALLAGSAMAFYGMSLLVCKNECWKLAGFWFGAGVGVAFLAKGFFMPVVLGIGFITLLITTRKLRNYNSLNALLIAGVIASPFLLVWPFLLYQHSYDLFMQWFWENNVGRFLGFSVGRLGADNEPYYIMYSALWFAFPVFPLAVAGCVREQRRWREPEYMLPVAIALIGLGFLLESASARALYILPLIPAFTMLAIKETLNLPAGFIKYWNYVIRFSGLAGIVVMWFIWGSLKTGYVIESIAQVFPVDFVPPNGQLLAIFTSVAATVFFLCCLRLDASSRLDTVRTWFAFIASIWIINNTLLLPWIDETKSYRPVLAVMEGYIKTSPYSQYCMNEYNLGESIAPMFEYFGDGHKLSIINNFSDADCPLVFTVLRKTTPENPEKGWKLVWKGSRVLDAKDEELRLYVKEQLH